VTAAITLGFKAFDAHELLCHFVAVHAGLYQRERIAVQLADITFVADSELPEHVFQASCGAALASAVKGSGQKVVFVAVDRPMFWIWSRAPLAGVAGLVRGRLATYPAIAPPHALANIVLRKAGLDVGPDGGRDVTLLPARDDVARLGLLRSGSVDAAVISSAIAPARMTGLGFHQLCFIGDELRLPTTGLAVDQAHLQRAPDQVRALVDSHRESLRLVHSDRDLTTAVLRDWFDVSPDIAAATAQCYATAFTTDGRTSPAIAQGAIDALCTAMGIAVRPAWDRVYACGQESG
jgi:ABC-type nitrate/sulfonate/bicarbonate transport system substrate-binding protein